jgi:glycosyltransferase involved in cell wall biosynthesis
MNIVLISNYTPDAQQSMLRYPEMLRRVLVERGHAVRIVHPPAVLGRRLRRTYQGVAKWIAYIDKYLLAYPWLRWRCRGAELVHICDHSNAMYLDYVGRVPRVVTCHDLLEVRSARGEQPGRRVGRMGRRLQQWIMNSMRKAPYIVCVSRKTADDLRELAPEVAGRVTVIHHALNWTAAPGRKYPLDEALRSVGVRPGTPYFLHVGGGQWYKNRLGAIRIFAELRKRAPFRDAQFVMAGAGFEDETRDWIESCGVTGAVIEAGRIADDVLDSLYHGALALLFPSLEEGFGWPILEAQACQCLVITTNRPPMTEIAGGGAILINPEDVEGAAVTIAEQWPRREEVIARASRNFANFSPERMARAYCEAYEEALRLQKPVGSQVQYVQNPR